MPVTRIVKLEEKYSTYHYDVSTDEQFSRVALEVLRRRDAEGQWYFDPKDYTPYVSDNDKELAAVSDEVAKALPASLREEIAKAKKAIRRSESEKKKMQAWWDLLRETIDLPDEEALAKQHKWTINLSTGPKEKSRPMVQVLLESRSDHQYEGVEFIELDELD